MAYRKDIQEIIDKENIGFLKEGFGGNFMHGVEFKLNIVEIPINHFNRNYGNTVVFKFSKIPGIVYRNIMGYLNKKIDFKI